MKIALIVLAVFLVLMTAAGAICYYTLAVPNMKPLSDQERLACEKIIKSGKGYFWVCARAVKTGKCPCLPCRMLDEERKAQGHP